MAQIFVSGVAHFFVVVGGSKIHERLAHFFIDIYIVPCSKVKLVAKMLKAIHAQESKKAAREKAKAVVAELNAMKLKEAAKKVDRKSTRLNSSHS